MNEQTEKWVIVTSQKALEISCYYSVLQVLFSLFLLPYQANTTWPANEFSLQHVYVTCTFIT